MWTNTYTSSLSLEFIIGPATVTPRSFPPELNGNFIKDPKKMLEKSGENPKKIMQIIIGIDMWNFS